MNVDSETKEAIAKMMEVLKKNQVDFVLIGALVPAFIAAEDKNELLETGARETRDIDGAISIDSWKKYARLREQLIDAGFEARPDSPEHRLHFGDVMVDLLPSGKGITKSNKLIWPESGNSMNVLGFEEAFAFSKEVQIAPGLQIKVAPLWVFAILKLFAYIDRKLSRDAYDLVHTLNCYQEGSDRKFDEVPYDTDFSVAGALLCGIDVQKLAIPSTVKALRKYLTELLTKEEYSEIVTAVLRQESMVEDSRRRRRAFELLKAFSRGLQLERS